MHHELVEENWPCPCCGHLTLADGPGAYELCPVCSWEDDGAQLRWPWSADGANGISLVEAQQNFIRSGAAHPDSVEMARAARADEPRDEGWRPFDPTQDRFEAAIPAAGEATWPRDPVTLYWWRPTYWRGERARGSVDVHEKTPADALVDELRRQVPEAGLIIDHADWQFGSPPPFRVFSRLRPLVVEAHESGNEDLASRVLDVLDQGLRSEDAYIHNCVSIAFLEDDIWHQPTMAAFISGWPEQLRAEITRQIAHASGHPHRPGG